MPDPHDYNDEKEWMQVCVPMMHKEGRDRDQAVAMCMSMWREKDKKEWTALKTHAGTPVKALGDGKIGGYLVRYGSEDDVDLEGDFFNAGTDYGVVDGGKLPVYYQHGMDAVFQNKRLAHGTISFDDVGLWFEAQLELRDDYEKRLYQLAEMGKLGLSSGAAGHLVEREPIGKAMHIKTWPIAEASLTPTPAEPRNMVAPIDWEIRKSVLAAPLEAGTADKGDKHTVSNTNKENAEMEKEELKALLDESAKSLVETVKVEAAAAATKAVKEFADSLPVEKPKLDGDVKVIKDGADQPFETKGEFFMAVKNAALYPGRMDRRLLGLKGKDDDMKATGLNEAIPSQGGFLVPPQIAAGILDSMFAPGTLLNLFKRDPVQGNSMTYNAVDETSRADGSRFGGIQGYWAAEGATKTASKPKFRQIELKLKKVYALCVATDELLEDAGALESWLGRNVPQELRFKVEDAIINGDGVGKPLGILNSGALVSATRTDANEIDPLDIGRMWAARLPGLNDYVWFGNQSIFPQILNMSIGNVPMFVGPGGLGGLPYATILGKPYYDTEYNPTLGTLGDLMLVSPSQYLMIEKAGGIQYASSIHVYFTQDESAFRFVYRVDGAPSFNTTVTGFDSTSYSPYVALAATT